MKLLRIITLKFGLRLELQVNMRILIIEDDQNKLKQILEWFESETLNAVVEKRFSFQSGLKAIVQGGFDLVILDMSMPTFDISPEETGGRPRPFAGKEILMQLVRRNIKIPVIVVTQFDRFGESDINLTQLTEELKKSYSRNFVGTVYYNPGINNWKDDLKILLKTIGLKKEEENDFNSNIG